MRYCLEIGKHRNGLLFHLQLQRIIYFPAFTSVNKKEYKRFQWGKATVKVSLLVAICDEL